MMVSSQELYSAFFKALEDRQLEEASSLIQQLLLGYETLARTHSAAAALAMLQQDYDKAEIHLERAVNLDPYHGELLFNWIQLLLTSEKKEKAEKILLPLVPEHISFKDADVCLLFAKVLVVKDFNKALDWVQTALAYFPHGLWPDFAERIFKISPGLLDTLIQQCGVDPMLKAQRSVWVQMYVFLTLEQQEFNSAAPYLVEALDYNNELASIVYRATSFLHEKKDYASLDRYFSACEPHLSNIPIEAHVFYRAWAICSLRNHYYDQANLNYDKAILNAPHPLTYAFEKISHFPEIYVNEKEIHILRQQFAYQLGKLEQQVNRCIQHQRVPHIYLRYPFQLAYQGLNDKDLVSQLGRIAHRIQYGSDVLQTTTYVPSQTLPLKVGFVSSYFFNHSVMKAYGKGIVELAKDTDLDVYVLHIGQPYDTSSVWIATNVPHFIHEPHVSKAIDVLREWQLDVLIYTDVGMASESYFMAVQRLAPIQGVLGGHPVTTGIPHMDYFFRAGRKYLKGVEQYYSEKVVLLERGIGKANHYLKPVSDNRDMFTFATPEHHVYFCPMTLIKIHPSFDKALEGILQKDPKGQVYFVENAHEPEISKRLYERFSQSIAPELVQRIYFIPWLKKELFFDAVCAADVILDSFGFGSGTTTYQVLSMHQPIVTLPGNLYRNSITLAYYERFGMDEPVAHSVEDYVNKAILIANDKAYRQNLQAKIAACVAVYPSQQTTAYFKESLIYLARNYGKLDPQQRVFSF